MQLTHTLFALFSTSALAARVSMSASTNWTLEKLVRVCDTADDSCTWTFDINTNEEGVKATACTYTVAATKTEPASQSSGGPATCGVFTITSGWSGQFGPDEGFTVISVVDYAKKLIAYAGYTDAMTTNGTTVDPDLTFPVQLLS
ncbi:surface protein 1 [Xylaria bambusicola]|uniref:surface protein 1 n=1 Tax=Xylaria bambusicola TaxID=326684 RepID=UPI0020077C01|nr:surface protein 1 [Xylaria bambusicola]KAI0508296.1 surface protein 1 [Xylaria bambusicola]